MKGRLSDIAAVTGGRLTGKDADFADFNRPVEIRLVEDFPRSTLEKIAKAQLRTLLDN